MNIAISGYTAAGKTTHARLLADALGREPVWAAGMLLERLGFDLSEVSESDLWFHRYAEIHQRRQTVSVDEQLDADLARLARQRQDLVFDARFLPWATDAPCIRIWLESDLPSRARKCHVSLGAAAAPVTECAVHAHRKDGLDVARLAETHHGTFGPDRGRFDVILDNSSLIPDATDACAQAGIKQFHRYLCAAESAMRGDCTMLQLLREEDGQQFRDVVRFVKGVSLDSRRLSRA